MNSPLISRFAGTLHVANYGAIGDGVTDDGPAIQRAMDDAFDLKQPLEFDGKVYITRQELDNKGITMRGCRGAGPTAIRAGVATTLTAVMKVTGVTFMHDFTIDGNGYAKHAMRLQAASYSVFENIKFYYTLSDGLNSEGLSDTVILRNCMSQSNGTIYRTSAGPIPVAGVPKIVVSGTVSTTSGSKVLEFSDPHDWAAMNVRMGDWIAISGTTSAFADCEIFCIGTIVDSTHLEAQVYMPSLRNATGKGFAIMAGDGVRQEISSDNNNWYLTTYRCLNVAGAGLSFAGLYGARVDQLQADACGGPAVRVGIASSTAVQASCIVTRLSGIYAETFGEQTPWCVFGSCFGGLEIEDVKFGFDAFYTPNPSLGFGNVSAILSEPGVISRPIGDPQVDYTLKARLYRTTALGEMIYTPVGIVAVAGTTINVAHATIAWTSGNPGIMTAVPNLSAGIEGQILHLFYTDVTGSITLQSDAALTGSGLQLQSNTVTLSRRDSISLIYTDGYWREISRSIAAGPVVSNASTGNVAFSATSAGRFSANGTLKLTSDTLGAGSSDVCTKIGTTIANTSVHATAKIFSIDTGIGGTEVEQASMTKAGVLNLLGGLTLSGYANSLISCSGSWIDIGIALPVRTTSYFASSATGTSFYASGNGAFGALNTAKLWSETAAGASDIATKFGTYIADGSVDAATKLASFRTGLGGTEVEKLFIIKDGTIENTTNGAGIVLKSPDGTRYRVTVANGGTVAVAAA